MYGRTIASLNSTLNHVLNKLFNLPRHELSVLNLSPLPPLDGLCEMEGEGWCNREPLEFVKEIDFTSVALDPDGWGELGYNPVVLFPIIYFEYALAPDYPIACKIPGPSREPGNLFKVLFDFILVELCQPLEFAQLTGLKLKFRVFYLDKRERGHRCIYHSFELYPQIDRAVKLGSLNGRPIFCVPLVENNDLELQDRWDFVAYLRHVFAWLDHKSEKPERHFTWLSDIDPDSTGISSIDIGLPTPPINIFFWHHF